MGENVLRIHVAISYGKETVLAKFYSQPTGKTLAKFVMKQFPAVLE